MMSNRATRVLLVEDNAADARLLKERLTEIESSDFELLHVDRVTTAISHLAAGGIDAVLLDLSLPDASGLAALRCIRADARGIPIVIVTGLGDQTVALEALSLGAQDYLIKEELDASTLVRALRYGVERQRCMTKLDRANREFTVEMFERRRVEEALRASKSHLERQNTVLKELAQREATGKSSDVRIAVREIAHLAARRVAIAAWGA